MTPSSMARSRLDIPVLQHPLGQCAGYSTTSGKGCAFGFTNACALLLNASAAARTLR